MPVHKLVRGAKLKPVTKTVLKKRKKTISQLRAIKINRRGKK